MYADIYSLEAPPTAAPGTTVEVALNLINDYSAPLGLRGIIQYSGPDGLLHDVAYDTTQHSSSTNPGAILPVKGHFTLPNGAVTVYGQSQYWNGGSWTAGQTQQVSIALAQAGIAPAPLSGTDITIKLTDVLPGAVSWWPSITLAGNPAQVIQSPAPLGLGDSWTADLSQLGITSSGPVNIVVELQMSDGSTVYSYTVPFTAQVGHSYIFDFNADTIADTTGGGGGIASVMVLVYDINTIRPVIGAQVTLGSQTSVTGSSGQATFSGLTPGIAYSLKITAAGYQSDSESLTFYAGSNEHDVTLTPSTSGGGTGAPTIKITNSPVSDGQVDFSLSGFTPSTNVLVQVLNSPTGMAWTYVTTDASGNVASGSFTDIDPAGNYTLEAIDNAGVTAQVALTLGSSSAGGGGGGGGTPTFRITNSPVSGGEVDFSLSGLPANTPVEVSVNSPNTSVQPRYVNTDSSGGASGSFVDNDPAGTYYLIASWGGTPVQTAFTLGSGSGGGGGTGTPTLKITNSPVSGGKVDFSFSGFTPSTYVNFNVSGGITTVVPQYVMSDASGGGSGSFTDDDPAGAYYLEASDGVHNTSAAFTLGAGSGGGGGTGTGYPDCTEISGLNIVPDPPVEGGSASAGFGLVNLSGSPLDLKGEIVVTNASGQNIPVQYYGGQSGTVNPGTAAAGLISASFMAPSEAITITANTYYQDSSGAWVNDQTKTLSVTSQAPPSGGGGGGSSNTGSGSSWTGILPWIVGIAVVAIIVPVLMSVFKKKQAALPAGRGG